VRTKGRKNRISCQVLDPGGGRSNKRGYCLIRLLARGVGNHSWCNRGKTSHGTKGPHTKGVGIWTEVRGKGASLYPKRILVHTATGGRYISATSKQKGECCSTQRPMAAWGTTFIPLKGRGDVKDWGGDKNGT